MLKLALTVIERSIGVVATLDLDLSPDMPAPDPKRARVFTYAMKVTSWRKHRSFD